MENHLGRSLRRNKGNRLTGKAEVVHHIDGDKTNNDIGNLDLCTVKEHNACHARMQQIVFDLYKQGLVIYDPKTKTYSLR